MAPKSKDSGKSAGKGKGKAKDDAGSTESGKLKAAQSLNARHILVCPESAGFCARTDSTQCEKHSKKEEALAKLREGVKFDEVAREFSEDKARQGKFTTAQPFSSQLTGVGGSLGWKARGSLHGDFEKVAYELTPSTTANPNYAEVKTSHGYHIIMVEGRR